MVLPLWEDWLMMNRLHMSKQELDAMDEVEYAIFCAFARGEAQGIRQKRDAESAQANMRRGR